MSLSVIWSMDQRQGFGSVFGIRIRIKESKNEELDVLFWELKAFFQLNFFPIFGYQNPGSGSVFNLKCWIRIRVKRTRIRVTWCKSGWGGGGRGELSVLAGGEAALAAPTVRPLPELPTLKENTNPTSHRRDDATDKMNNRAGRSGKCRQWHGSASDPMKP